MICIIYPESQQQLAFFMPGHMAARDFLTIHVPGYKLKQEPYRILHDMGDEGLFSLLWLPAKVLRTGSFTKPTSCRFALTGSRRSYASSPGYKLKQDPYRILHDMGDEGLEPPTSCL